MRVLDPLHRPSGNERHTGRPVWRVQDDHNDVRCAFVEMRDGRLWITGYPAYGVDARVPRHGLGPAPAIALCAGAVIGGVVGGPAGAVLGGLLGALLGAGAAR